MELKLTRELTLDHPMQQLSQQQSGPESPSSNKPAGDQDALSERAAAGDPCNEILIISVNGELDTNTAGTLETSLAEEYNSGSRFVILELSQMEYVSSVGLRVLLAHLKKLKASQGRLVLSGLNSEVQEIFDMAGFSSLFEISADLEAARRILRA